ncbi:MAG: amidohydrolase [Bryobacteraceae bacterium]|jgi:imidazolonepropionase-like amidohydrolase
MKRVAHALACSGELQFAGLLVVSLSLPLFAGPATVIQNATVLTVTKGTFHGSILIRDGKIVEAGEKVLTPEGARVIDASGQYVMPGIIDCHSHIAADSINEGAVAVSSMVGIEDVLNPEDPDIYRALAGGVTTANILHGSANPIGGKCMVLKMRWGKDAQGMIFQGAPPSIKFALGENVKRSGSPSGGFGATPGLRYPATRMGVEDVIREAFTRARAYQKEWSDYQAKVDRHESAVPPRRDLQLEPLVEVLEGKRYVHAHCYRADEILMLLRVADDFGFKIRTLQHVLEGYKVAKEIAAHGTGASTFSDWWAYKAEAYDAIPYNAAMLVRAGVLTSVNSDSAELMRHLNTEAAKAMKYGGLNETEALSLVTINPAKQMGIDQHVGSIEPGKDADLTIFDKHPLSNYAKVTKVFIDGDLYFDRDKDLEERPGKEIRKKALVDKLKAQEKKERKKPEQSEKKDEDPGRQQ